MKREKNRKDIFVAKLRISWYNEKILNGCIKEECV